MNAPWKGNLQAHGCFFHVELFNDSEGGKLRPGQSVLQLLYCLNLFLFLLIRMEYTSVSDEAASLMDERAASSHSSPSLENKLFRPLIINVRIPLPSRPKMGGVLNCLLYGWGL